MKRTKKTNRPAAYVRSNKEHTVMVSVRRKEDISPLVLQPRHRKHLDVAQTAKAFAPDATDISEVRRYAGAQGLKCIKVSLPGRGIPDVAANASSDNGYLIEANETRMSLGGTSAVAPVWAALVARLNEALETRIGFFTPLLYKMNAASDGAVFEITRGYNGANRTHAFHARLGWDPCTGFGSPNGEKLLHWLRTSHTKGR